MRWRRPLVVGRPGGVVAVVVLLAAAACSSEVAVEPPAPGSEAATACRTLVADLPDTVDDADVRSVSPDDGLTAAWGDPAIVLRCGVDRPTRLEPTSFCFVVNDVGWYAESNGDPLDGNERSTGTVVFTTIDRSPYVEVTVPADDSRSPVDPLTDLAAAVIANTQGVKPCQ